MSMKQHFSSNDYDITKYKWNFLNIPLSVYEKRNDIKYFEILARKKIMSEHEWIAVLTVGFKKNASMWTKDFLYEYADLRREAEIWMDRIGNLPYIFEQETKKMLDQMNTDGIVFDSRFAPWLLKESVNNRFTIELYIIYSRMFKFNLTNDVNYIYLYKEKWLSYDRIFVVDVDRYKGILEKIIIERREVLS